MSLRKSAVLREARSVAKLAFLVLFLRAFVVQAYHIPSGSMIPTLQVGDRIFVNKFIYGWKIPFVGHKLGASLRPPRRGEVVVFAHPRDPATDLIKRVVAVAGDTVEVKDGVVRVNGQTVLQQPLTGDCRYFDVDAEGTRWSPMTCRAHAETLGAAHYTALAEPGVPPRDFAAQTVPARSLFVLGDNRDRSSDSRYFGFVPLDLVAGRALVVWWSQGGPEGVRFGRILHAIH